MSTPSTLSPRYQLPSLEASVDCVVRTGSAARLPACLSVCMCTAQWSTNTLVYNINTDARMYTDTGQTFSAGYVTEYMK
jgi:hypothetical protein